VQRVVIEVNHNHIRPRASNPNPDPANYSILGSYYSENTGRLAVRIRYPDATNYEGVKVLVYRDTTLAQLKEQKTIDPHFSESTRFKSPFARFEPTKVGWEMARRLVDDST